MYSEKCEVCGEDNNISPLNPPENCIHCDAPWNSRQRARQLQRLNIALGMLAPGGTAPRTALEELWQACANGTDPRQAVAALRRMLEPAWPDHEALTRPHKMPDPSSADYANGGSVLEALRLYQAVG